SRGRYRGRKGRYPAGQFAQVALSSGDPVRFPSCKTASAASQGAFAKECSFPEAYPRIWRIMDNNHSLAMKFICHIANSFMHRGAQPLFCLFAAFLLQAPLMASLLLASGACCAGDRCPIAAHHHAAPKAQEAPMDCDHNMDHGGVKLRS